MAKEVFSNYIRTYVDWKVIICAIALTVIGLLSVFSATHDSAMAGHFTHQMVAACIGIILMFMMMFSSERILDWIAYPAYGFAILCLIAVLLIGRSAYGARAWINILGFSYQPSEFAKLATILALSKFLTHSPRDLRRISDLAIAAGIVFIPVILVLLQPDAGTTTVFFVILFGMMLWTGADLFLLLVIASVPIICIAAFIGTIPAIVVTICAVGGVFAFRRRFLTTIIAASICIVAAFSTNIVYQHIKPHQQRRIDVFLHPSKDPLGAGYNELQAQMAVGSGGLIGKGFLQGTQTQLRYIPKQWTDFIYCVPTEEFGFIGGATVVILFTVLLWRGVWIASQSRQQFASNAAIGIVTMILFHATVNMGMDMGLVPVMGIPLPFLSYGGTFLMVDLLCVGILLNVFRTRFVWR